jgi:predicted nucleic acid-binding protein
MSRIFVDTWAWYALADVADSDHVRARRLNEQLLARGYTFVTTNFVLSETVTLIRYHLHHQAAVRFWAMLHALVDAELVQLVRVTELHENAAWEIFERFADQKFSYTDCTSFAVMRDLGLQQVFSADHHFATLGFLLVS